MFSKFANSIGNKITALDNKFNKYFVTLFIITIVLHFFISLIGWNNVITDGFGLRQTQTAITSYYTIKEGFRINYITPIFGPPWTVPMEFPVYQWIVAGIVKVFNTPLDQTGRGVSLFFFYSSLLIIFLLLRTFFQKKYYRYILLSLIITNPIYLFWSRTFMIESTALFFCLLFLWLVVKGLKDSKYIYFILAAIAGAMGSLTKVTTFVPVSLIAFLFFIYFWRKNSQKPFSLSSLSKYFIYGITTIIIPILVTVIWVKYSDQIKSTNLLASNLTSTELKVWNFGTWEQRLSLPIWGKIFDNNKIVSSFLDSSSFGATNYEVASIYRMLIFFLVILICLLFNKRRRKEILCSMICFLFAPFIFLPLHYHHDYYSYANCYLLSIMIGLLLISFIEIGPKSKLLTKYIVYPLIIFLMLSHYSKTYYKSIKGNKELLKLCNIIKKNTSKDDVIYIYGWDCDSRVPYYSQRKAIMNFRNYSLSNKHLQKIIKSTNVKAVLLNLNDLIKEKWKKLKNELIKNKKINYIQKNKANKKTGLAKLNNIIRKKHTQFINNFIINNMRFFHVNKEPIYRKYNILLFLVNENANRK